MKCSYYDCTNEICTNPKCPMRGAACPVPDAQEICKYGKMTDPLLEASERAYYSGAEAMRRAALWKIQEMEAGCLGIQKAAFLVTREAIKNLEVPRK